MASLRSILVPLARRLTLARAAVSPASLAVRRMAVVPNTKYVQGMRVKAEAQPKPVEAVKLIADVPPIEVAGRTTHCDGGDGALGHPRVFINLDKKSGAPAVCGYCGKRFVTKPGSHGHH